VSHNAGKIDQSTGSAVNKLGAVVKSALVRTGIEQRMAIICAGYCMAVYRYLLEHPRTMIALKSAKDAYDVADGSQKAFRAAGYIERGSAVGVSSARSGFAAYGASGGAGVLQVFTDYFESFAKTQGIDLNECSMAVAKVSLDIGAAGIGSVAAVSGWGLVFAGLRVIATARDSYALGQVCFGRPTAK
jgi:hypothetical protein